jgi:hypothetical protein
VRLACGVLACDGESFPLLALEMLAEELLLALALLGCPDPSALGEDHVKRRR